VGDRARWFLLTPDGRRALVVAYLAAGAASVATHWTLRTATYALGLAALIVFAPLWARWCLRRAG
jgi:hypothetical protein